MWVRTEDDILLNMSSVRAIKMEKDKAGGLLLVAYGDEAAYGGQASSVIIRRFPVGAGRTREAAVEEAAQALDLVASSLEGAGQLVTAAPARTQAFRTL